MFSANKREKRRRETKFCRTVQLKVFIVMLYIFINFCLRTCYAFKLYISSFHCVRKFLKHSTKYMYSRRQFNIGSRNFLAIN